MMVAMVSLAVLGVGDRAEATRRRPLRCCIMVPADDGGERPYCFNLNVRPKRSAKRICRAIGGMPLRPEVR
jgi:hypothetical protein